jgi:hypothetical protein
MLLSVEAEENLLNQVLRFTFVSKNATSNRKRKTLISPEQDQKRLSVPSLDTSKQFFVGVNGRPWVSGTLAREGASGSQERQSEHPFYCVH